MVPRPPRPAAGPVFRRSLVLSLGMHAAAFGAALLVAFGPQRGIRAAGPSAVVMLAEAELETTWSLETPPDAPSQEVEAPTLPAPELVPVEEPLEALEEALEPDEAPLAEPLFDWGTTRVDQRPLARLERRPEPVQAAPAAPSQPAASPAPRGEDRPLRLLEGPPPDYPRLALRLQQEGTVLLELEVDAEGNVREVHVLKTSGFERLDDAARKGVLSWRFEPALEDGVPVASSFQHPIKFVLE